MTKCILSDLYNQIISTIKRIEEIPNKTQVQIGETEGRKNSISVLIKSVGSIEDICGNILLRLEADITYQVISPSDKEKTSALELLDKIKSEIVSKLGYRCETAVALEGKNPNGMEIFTLKFNLGAYNI